MFSVNPLSGKVFSPTIRLNQCREVVEAIKTLSLGEKEEIQSLLEQFLREEQRDEIYQNYLLAKQNEKEGKLKFSSDIDQLMQFLEE